VAAAKAVPQARLVMTDINPAALALAGVNASAAGVEVEMHCGDMLAGYDGPVDVVIANPPYILDPGRRIYRDGGSDHGAGVSIEMAEKVLPRLSPGGRFILYSGSAIINGTDRMRDRLHVLAEANRCSLDYREIDPDVFGEELGSPAYADVERIAVVAAIFANQISKRT
jgi:methylase of polypeptide subunit release factors